MKNTTLLHAMVMVLGLTGCTVYAPSASPSGGSLRTEPAYMLLLDRSFFPEVWEDSPCTPTCDEAQGESRATRSLHIPDRAARIHQEVYRFATAEDASKKFQLYREVKFRKMPPPQEPSTELLPPPFIHYQSRVATDSYIGCGVDIVPVCKVILQYDTYFVYFFINIESVQAENTLWKGDGLPIAHVEHLLMQYDIFVSKAIGTS